MYTVQKHNIYHRNDSVESYSVHVYVRFWFHAKAPQKNKLIRKETYNTHRHINIKMEANA